MKSAPSRQGSTLLLTICLFLVFIIFAAALVPLSRRAFENTAVRIQQQQAQYVAQSAAEAFVSQLDQPQMEELLEPVMDTGKPIETGWFDYDDQSQFQFRIERIEDTWQSSEYWDSTAWEQAQLRLTATSRSNGKTAAVSAVIQGRRTRNQFYDLDMASMESVEMTRILWINECRTPTPASASFWIDAVADKEVTRENLQDDQQPAGPDSSVTVADPSVNEQPVMIYRNIQHPVVTGELNADLVLEPAEYTKAEIGSSTPGKVVVNGDVYCKGDLILNNVTVSGTVYATGRVIRSGFVSAESIVEAASADQVSKYDQMQPLLTDRFPAESMSVEEINDAEAVIKTRKNGQLTYALTNADLKSVKIENQGMNRNYFLLKTMPESIEVYSETESYRPVFYIDDPHPVLTDQIKTTLLSSENIILVFSHPVTIQSSLNVSVAAPTIRFAAEHLTLSGRYQACRFEKTELVDSVRLIGRNTSADYSYPRSGEPVQFRLDLLYYEGAGER